jgi:hypothetical protein
VGFDVENVLPINWPSREDMVIGLILDDSGKDIRALTQKHARTEDNWSAACIGKKKRAANILLHGSLGTGKTFTVGE